MRQLCAVLLATILIASFVGAQTDSPTASSSSTESDWLPHKAWGAPGRAIKAPGRALGKLLRRVPSAPAPEDTESSGVVAFEQLQAKSTSLGTVFILNTDAGYAFNSHLTAEAGVPIFFVRSPFSLVTNHDWRWTTWLLGDPYVDLRYTTKRFGPTITSVITGTIPVASTQRIYSTGRFGVDWFNHIEKTYKGVTPFVNLGAANGTVNRFVMPRPYSMARPYQTLGFISDFEGGLSYRIRRAYTIGASAYALVPGGPQKVFSRLVAPDYALGEDGNHNRSFDSAFLTVGASGLARDNGFSGWVEITRLHHTSLQVAYTRSVHYALDSLTVMLNFDGGFLFKESK